MTKFRSQSKIFEHLVSIQKMSPDFPRLFAPPQPPSSYRKNRVPLVKSTPAGAWLIPTVKAAGLLFVNFSSDYVIRVFCSNEYLKYSHGALINEHQFAN